MPYFLQPHRLQHARLLCPSLSTGIYSNLHQLSWWWPYYHLILCCPLLLLPSIVPSIRVFSSESVLHIRWPKYWSFSFNISPSNEYSGLISFRIDWFDLLAVQGTLESSPKREPSYTAGGNVNWYSHYGRWYGDSLKKLGIKPPYDPAILLLGIYLEETKIEKDMCIPSLIAALFTIARTWKQLRCPSTDEWIKKLWYIYTMECYSAIKRNAFEAILMRWMNLEPIIQSEAHQKEK